MPTTYRYQGIVYRAHDPKWAFDPDSGQGAALYGGRFNRPDKQALYTATTIMGAITEAAQGMLMRLQPMTVVAYQVDHAAVLDLSNPQACAKAGVDWQHMACDWAYCAARRQAVPSWALADELQSRGVGAILVPSFAVGAATDATNLVFWQWQRHPPLQVTIIDDEGSLPRNRSSWG